MDQNQHQEQEKKQKQTQITETRCHNEWGFATRAIHAGQEPRQWMKRDVVPPISMNSTFSQEMPQSFDHIVPHDNAGYEYSRCNNPTRHCLEKVLAPLENANYALAFGSGISAITSLVYLLKTGDHIVLVDDVYSGASAFFLNLLPRMGISVSFVDMTCKDLGSLRAAIRPNTTMVWFEVTTNPMLKVIDVKAVCELVRSFKDQEIIIGVDSTLTSPLFINPLDLGVDIVMHSLTKYMNGHSDVIMGTVMCNDLKLFERIKFIQMIIGAVPSPFDCYLVNRGLKTLSLRMRRFEKNGLRLATWLEQNPRIEKVLYPALPSHPQHDVYKKQMKGCSGMIGFYVKTNLEGNKKFMSSLKIVTIGISLGGYESLIGIPTIMSDRSLPVERKAVLGITDNFVRFSCGLEEAEDIIADIDQALKIAIPMDENQNIIVMPVQKDVKNILNTKNEQDQEQQDEKTIDDPVNTY